MMCIKYTACFSVNFNLYYALYSAPCGSLRHVHARMYASNPFRHEML